MTKTYGFFQSSSGDRVYSAQQMGEILEGVISSGVFENFGNAFEVLVGTGMDVTVGTGKAWFNNTWFKISDTVETLTLSAGDASNPRIDLIVIEVDFTTVNRKVDVKVVEGTPAGSPVEPTLLTGPNVYQYEIAKVDVAALAVSLVQGDITYTVGLAGSADYIQGVDGAAADALEARITVNEGDIDALETLTTTHTGQIATNTADISTLQGDMNTKANVTLGNLGATAVNADINPNTNASRTLGTSALKWLNGFFKKAVFDEDAAPSTPSAGDVVLYAKTDGLLYSKDDLGTETLVSGGPAGGSPLTTKGDIFTFDTVNARLPVGSSGYYLSADPAEATGLKWVPAPSGTSPLTTKGDLFGFSTVNARIPVGTNGQVLEADSAEGVGVKWVSPTKSAGIVVNLSGESVAVGDGDAALTIPLELNGWNLSDAIASVHTKGITGTTDVQIRRRRGGVDADMLSTKITIGDEFSARDGVIDGANDDLQTGDQIYIDVDAIHSGTAPKGLSVSLTFSL